MNKSGQRALQIFNDLDRRLKSADKKDQFGVGSQWSKDRGQGTKGRGQGRGGKQKGERHQTSYTTATVKIC